MSKATRSRTLWSSGRGQSLVEFALLLPLLLVVAFIITEFGRALWIKNMLTQAVGQAARAAIVSTSGSYQGAAETAANRLLGPVGMGTESTDPSEIFASLDPPGNPQYVKIRMTRWFSFIPGGGVNRELPTTPGARGPYIGLGRFEIVAETTMDLQPGFGG